MWNEPFRFFDEQTSLAVYRRREAIERARSEYNQIPLTCDTASNYLFRWLPES